MIAAGKNDDRRTVGLIDQAVLCIYAPAETVGKSKFQCLGFSDGTGNACNRE